MSFKLTLSFRRSLAPLLLAAAFCGAIVLHNGAARAQQLPTAGLVFHAPFDESLDALVGAATQPTGRQGEFPLVEGRAGEGRVNRAVRTGAKDSFLMYDGSNVSGSEGTVSFWVRPAWDGAQPNFHLLWSLISNGRFLIYKHESSKTLSFLIQGANTGGDQLTLVASAAELETGRWNHVAATWSAGNARFYLNGELQKEVNDPTLRLPIIAPGTNFFVGDYYHPAYGTQAGLKGEADTDIDELRLYERSLEAREISALAGRKAEQVTAIQPPKTAHVAVPKTGTAPKIDGNFSFGEWKDAAAFSGFFDIATGGLSDKQTTVLLTYDDTNLYMALFAPLTPGAALQSTVSTRDGAVWQDDSIEIYLDPAHERKADRGVHFVGNAAGHILDVKDGDTAWNANWQYQASVTNNWQNIGLGYWIREIAIPFAELGRATPVDGEKWAANFAVNWVAGQAAQTSWAWLHKQQYFTPERFGTLEFREKTPAFQWSGLRDLITGQPTLEGRFSGASGARLDISTVHTSQPLARRDLAAGPGQPQEWTQTLNLPPAPSETLRIEARDADNRVLYSAELPYQVDVQPLRVFVATVPSQKRLLVDIDPLQYRRAWSDGWSLDVQVKDRKTNTLARKKVDSYTPPFARAEFDLGALPTGEYQVAVSIHDAAGKQRAQQLAHFSKPADPVWLNNKIGVTDKVLRPWTPIVATPASLGVWGREYTFGRNALPQQISSLKTPLLQAPMRLMVDGQPLPASADARYTRTTPARAERSGASTAGAWNVSWNSWAEFDGVLWYEVTIAPRNEANAAQLNSLALEIPFNPQQSTLYASVGDSGATPRRWQSAWKQGLWVGNEKMGLNWFAESGEHWSLRDSNAALTLEREASRTLARINFVTMPKRVDKPITYRFGLLATPARPMPQDWRALQYSSSTIKSFIHTDPEKPNHALSWWMSWSPYISSPLDVNEQDTKEIIASFHKAGAKAMPYNSLAVVNGAVKDYKYFEAEWLLQPRRGAGGEGTAQETWFVNPKSSYGDFMLYGMRELLRTHKWDGLYFDFNGGALPDANELHGSGYTDENGQRRPTYDVLAHREWHKRLWAMAQEETGSDEPPIMVHNSANIAPHNHTFTNMWLNGEQFQSGPKVDDDYTKVISRDAFRAEFLGSNFGIASFIMPQLNPLQVRWLQAPEGPEKEAAHARFRAAIDTMLLYPMMHGTLFYPSWLDMEYLRPIYEGRRALDIGTARFHGYWENANLVTLGSAEAPANPDVLASIYAQDDRFWLVLGNWTDAEQNVSAKLQLHRIAPKLAAGAAAHSLFNDGALSKNGDVVSMTVPPKSIRIVEIR